MVGIAAAHARVHSAHRDTYHGSDLNQFCTDRTHLRSRQFRQIQSRPAKLIHQHVSHRGKVQPQPVRTHRMHTGAVGKQSELLLLDSVLHLAPCAIQIFV